MAKKLLTSTARPALRSAARRADEAYGATAEPDWRDTDWRQHLRSAEIDGRGVNYVDLGSGEGPPVVFVHGLSGCWQNWLENIPQIARERRVIALDLPGFGHSEAPDGEISISNYADAVHAFCSELGLDRVVAVGNSMGGFIAAELAIRHPERVDRMVLADAAGISHANLMRRPTLTLARLAGIFAAQGTARSDKLVSRPGVRHLSTAFVFRHPTRLRQDLLYEQIRGANHGPAFLKALDAILSYDHRDRLPEIRCPALIVWGDQDMLAGLRDADEYERLIPDARKVVLEDTGHCPMIERPTAFNELLLDFLAESPRASREAPAAAVG